MPKPLDCRSINAGVGLIAAAVVVEDITVGVVVAEVLAAVDIIANRMTGTSSAMVVISSVMVVTNVMGAIRTVMEDINNATAAFSKEMEVFSNAVAIGDQVVTEVAVVDEVVAVEEVIGIPKTLASPEVDIIKGEIG